MAGGIFLFGYVLLALTQETRLNRMFNILTYMFDRVCLRTNVGKTVSMVFQTCCAMGGHSAESYGLRIMVEGLTHQEILLQQFLCPDFDEDLAAGFLDDPSPGSALGGM